MPFKRTESVIEDSEKLINDLSPGHPVETYLAQYALICLSVDVEQAVYDIIETTSSSVILNEPVKVFIRNASKRLLRSFKKGEIAGYLGAFGDEIKSKFNDLLNDNERDVTLYNDTMQARNDVAHVGGAKKSLSEIKEALKSAKIILKALADSLEDKLQV